MPPHREIGRAVLTMDKNSLPYDVERVKVFLQKTGWVPTKTAYHNGMFILNMEKTKSAKIHIEYEDMIQEVKK
jgi:hypothetical protein